MRRTSLSLLILALMVGACSDDGGPKVYKADELRVQLVSGDAQAGQVASEASASLSRASGISMQALPPGLEVLDQPLVVQLVTESGQRVMGASVPSGIRAAWIVEDQGCGRPFHGDTDFDSEGRAENLWIVGTKAGVECSMYAGRIVGGQVVIDSVFTAEFEPGPPARIHWDCGGVGEPRCGPITVGEPFDLREYIEWVADKHWNRIDIAAIPDSVVGWAWYGGPTDPDGPTGRGWVATAPSEFPDPLYGLMLWIQGVYMGGRMFEEAS